jgi:antitoxin ParD1/3/4
MTVNETILDGMRDEIRTRLATPREEFLPLEGDNAFDRVRARLEARKTRA